MAPHGKTINRGREAIHLGWKGKACRCKSYSYEKLSQVIQIDLQKASQFQDRCYSFGVPLQDQLAESSLEVADELPAKIGPKMIVIAYYIRFAKVYRG